MPKKFPKLDKNKEVKAIARERLGTPPPGRPMEEKKERLQRKREKRPLREDL